MATLPEPKKHPLASKTIWVNLLMALTGILIAFKPDLAGVLNESTILMLMGFVNVILRIITKDKISMD